MEIGEQTSVFPLRLPACCLTHRCEIIVNDTANQFHGIAATITPQAVNPVHIRVFLRCGQVSTEPLATGK
jgi:hypothetical protein